MSNLIVHTCRCTHFPAKRIGIPPSFHSLQLPGSISKQSNVRGITISESDKKQIRPWFTRATFFQKTNQRLSHEQLVLFLAFSIFQHWQHWHRFLLDPDPFGKNRRNWGVGNMDLRKWLNIFRLAKHKMNTWFTTIDEQYRKTAKKAWNKCRHEGTGFHLFGGYFND